MSDYEIVKECLDIILKKGDIYDNIAKREGVKLQKHTFVRNHILLFSRILYIGMIIFEKVKAHFSPIEEVKKAQDKIRGILGVNVDFVKTKHQFNLYTDMYAPNGSPSLSDVLLKYEKTRSPTLSILYENSTILIEEYVEHLKKILTFCELYEIDEVFLRESDISNAFLEIDLQKYPHVTAKKLLDCSYIQFPTDKNEIEDKKSKNNYDLDSFLSSELLQLTKSDLRNLIKQLEVVKISKQIVGSFRKKIGDVAVKNAIAEFLLKGNLGKLKAIVSSRLSLVINSDSSYREKNYGKVYQSVTVKDEYINVISSNKNGEVISNIVTTLYDYLGIIDYKALLKQLKIQSENQDILAMLALHLYLCQSIKIKGLNRESTSFYDFVYSHFKAKKMGRVKAIPGLYTKSDKRSKSLAHLFSNILISILLVAIILITGASIDFIKQMAFQKESDNVFDNILQTMVNPYIKSLEFEQSIIRRFMDFTQEAKVDFSQFVKTFSDDAKEDVPSRDMVVATVTELVDGYSATYFASGYAVDATYNSGRMEYTLEQPAIDLNDIQDLYPVLEVSVPISSSFLNQCINGNELNIPKLFYPLGDNIEIRNYVLTSISIYDMLDSSKIFKIDNNRVISSGSYVTEEIIILLESMKNPQIVYQYGIGYGMNSYIEDIEKLESYTENSVEVIRKAVTEGLGLPESATDYEIYVAIASKDYSLTPIADAGLSRKIKNLDEESYFRTISSMDSLICNLAATLVVGIDEQLVYTVGYHNTDDGNISEKEAHAWAMSSDGRFIDATPSLRGEETEEESFIGKMIVWGIENKIPVYALIAYIGYEVNKIFGKKIRFKIKVRKIAKELTDSKIEESYAKLRECLYGGINIPCTRPPTELLDAFKRDFGGFTVQELKEIKEMLLQSNPDEMEVLSPSLKILKDSPFLRMHSDSVKKVLMKKKKK